MTRKNGGAVETCQHMGYVRMEIKKIAIDGMWLDLQFFQEGDGSIRVEVENHITGKRYKMFPNNKVIFSEE